MKIIVLFFLLFSPLVSFSQTRADSISLTFPKILIINKKQEILLAFDSNRKAYEIPSIGVIKGPISFKSYLDKAAREFGITYDFYRLGGLFTYVFPDKYRTFIRPYFIIQVSGYINGHGLPDATCKWFRIDEALTEIKYPASAAITKKILGNPKAVWSATFEEYGYTNPIDVSKIKFRIVEDFTKID